MTVIFGDHTVRALTLTETLTPTHTPNRGQHITAAPSLPPSR